jgi:hypothetical protein
MYVSCHIRISLGPFDGRNESKPESLLKILQLFTQLFLEKLQVADAPVVDEVRGYSQILQARVPERLAMVLNERCQILDRKLLKYHSFRLNSKKRFIG